MMEKSGTTVSRWVDAVLEKNDMIDQQTNVKGLFFWGHAPNSQTRGLDMKRALDKLDGDSGSGGAGGGGGAGGSGNGPAGSGSGPGGTGSGPGGTGT